MKQVEWGTWYIDETPDPDRIPYDRSPRAPFHDKRVFELNNAYEVLLQMRPQLRKFSWGELLTGERHTVLRDDRHPNEEVSAVLWADMILYYLNRLESI